jgi:MutS2 family protein
MNQTAVKLLEYDRIKEMLKERALSDLAKEEIDRLEPSLQIRQIETWLKETTEARTLINRSSYVPIHPLKGIKEILDKCRKEAVLREEELTALAGFLKEAGKLKAYFAGKEIYAPSVCLYANSIQELDEVWTEIDRCIINGQVDDRATPALARIRKKIGLLEDRIKSKLDSIMASPVYGKYLQDHFVTVRDGRYVLPLKSEYRSSLEGSIRDRSASGSTVFVEPEGVRRLQDELNLLRADEEKEVFRILSSLTSLAASFTRETSINMEVTAHYDFIFSKAKLSKALNASSAAVNNEFRTVIHQGRHPLLGDNAIPLDFHIGDGYRALVITGPNTGGKTVAIKTVGLLTMMIQSGLHVPVGEGSEFAVFTDILADIGDGQSITESLSTFSSHIRNIISIVACAGPETLVILDELGSGTDPQEGMGLAVSLLETIHAKGATMLATTHHSEIKEFASSHKGFENGCMGFDLKTLKPLYQLHIGHSGESNAFLIALRLGLDKEIIERAHEVTYKVRKDYSQIHLLREDEEQGKVNEEIQQGHQLQEQKKERMEKTVVSEAKFSKQPTFQIGDCVWIHSIGKSGIVCEQENSRGEIGVMFQKKKIKVNVKRLSLYVPSKELYPDNYEMDIVLESKENRKKKKMMAKHHVEGLTITKDQ